MKIKQNKGRLFVASQQGKGIDRMGIKRDGLKLKWKWWKGLPSQECSAEIGKFKMRVYYWYNTYEAQLNYSQYSSDNELLSKGGSMSRDTILTRIEGQIIAESMLKKHYEYTKKMLKKLEA